MRTQTRLLKDHQLRFTASRGAILSLFLQNAHALSYADIEKAVAAAYDRVTVYRTLKAFVERGVLHKVLDDDGGLKYALCSDHCAEADHHHEHVHFKCLACGQTSCLEDVSIPSVSLPLGYQISELNLLIQGRCNRCN